MGRYIVYLLDTNICIYILNNKSEYVQTKLKNIDSKRIYLLTISFAEAIYVTYKSSYIMQVKRMIDV